MDLIFRSKDEWSWAGNETWIRRRGNLLSIEGRVTAMASSNCGLFEILGILGTKLVFHTGSSFCCGDVMRFTRLHNEALVRRQGRREHGAHLGIWDIPTLTGLWFLVPLVEPPSARWLPDLKRLALAHVGRCWCLPTGTSFTVCPLDRAGCSPRGRGRGARRSRGKRGSITLCKFSGWQSARQQVRSLEELSSLRANCWL